MNKHSFENFIIQCCKAGEKNLRKFIKQKLSKAGFSIIEDSYESHRGGEYSGIPNLLAIRGENPKICLVAHTDVCRDYSSDNGQRNIPEPVIKIVEKDGKERMIITDRHSQCQVGGDDRLGVAINLWIALNTGYDMSLLFTTDEECGAVSADEARFPELLEHEVLVQVDRGNRSNQLVTSIGGCELCSPQVAARLLNIAKQIGQPRYAVNGMLTDVLAIKSNGACKAAVNMTCGYHNSIGAQKDEYIDVQEARDTMQYVATIIQNYDLEDVLDGDNHYQSTLLDKFVDEGGSYSEDEYELARGDFNSWPNFQG